MYLSSAKGNELLVYCNYGCEPERYYCLRCLHVRVEMAVPLFIGDEAKKYDGQYDQLFWTYDYLSGPSDHGRN